MNLQGLMTMERPKKSENKNLKDKRTRRKKRLRRLSSRRLKRPGKLLRNRRKSRNVKGR